MSETLVALSIFMLGVIFGAIVGLIVILLVELNKRNKRKKDEIYELKKQNEELSITVEELKKSYQAILEDSLDETPRYENAFEFCSAVLEGKEELR